MIKENLSKKDCSKSNIFEYANIGKCHKYNPYDISPTDTNNLLDKISDTISPFLQNQIRSIVPEIGRIVINDG